MITISPMTDPSHDCHSDNNDGDGDDGGGGDGDGDSFSVMDMAMAMTQATLVELFCEPGTEFVHLHRPELARLRKAYEVLLLARCCCTTRGGSGCIQCIPATRLCTLG